MASTKTKEFKKLEHLLHHTKYHKLLLGTLFIFSHCIWPSSSAATGGQLPPLAVSNITINSNNNSDSASLTTISDISLNSSINSSITASTLVLQDDIKNNLTKTSINANNSSDNLDKSTTISDVVALSNSTANSKNITNSNVSSNSSNISAETSSSCSAYPILPEVNQPKRTEFSTLKKCCPKGQSVYFQENGPYICVDELVPFEPVVIDATFYESCIEDSEIGITLPYEYAKPCVGAETFIYGKPYDELYVLQNGSLLTIPIELDFQTYDIFDNFCLDVNVSSSQLAALVCYDSSELVHHVSKAQSYVYAICMLSSVPCLLVTAFLYFYIPKLRDLHGKSLASHSLCLAVGFLLLSIAQFKGNVNQAIGYIIQYFILACFFWLAVMCIDICIHVWYYLPRKISLTPLANLYRFIMYGSISMGVPLILVLLTKSKQLPGMPSYYLKGLTEAAQSSQQFFIPPISSILFICFVLLVASYFGFRELQPIVLKTFLLKKNKHNSNLFDKTDDVDVQLFEEIKQTARSTAYLYMIMTTNWIFEIISFYVQSSDVSLVIFDILNALQGIVIFIIFVCLPNPLRIIKHWWMDRGSLELNLTEMETLNNGSMKA